MANLLKLIFQKNKIDLAATEEHHVVLTGLEIAMVHGIHTVFMIDQTGAADTNALADLEAWLKTQGYFLHCVSVKASPPQTQPEK